MGLVVSRVTQPLLTMASFAVIPAEPLPRRDRERGTTGGGRADRDLRGRPAQLEDEPLTRRYHPAGSQVKTQDSQPRAGVPSPARWER
jgi:hypothetical protein